MKCIISKLASPIGDTSLYKFDELRLLSFVGSSMSTADDPQAYVAPANGESVKISAYAGKIYNDADHLDEIVGELTISVGKIIYCEKVNGEVAISVIGKSKLKDISASAFSIPTEQLKYTTAKIDNITFVEGALNDISYLNVGDNPKSLYIDKALSGELEADGKAKIIQYSDVEMVQPLGDYTFLAGNNNIRSLRLYFRDDVSVTELIANNPNLRRFHFNGLLNTWSTTSLRDSSYTPLVGTYRFKAKDDTDNFLINMAACQGTDYFTNKIITFTGARYNDTQAVNDAIASLRARGFTIN